MAMIDFYADDSYDIAYDIRPDSSPELKFMINGRFADSFIGWDRQMMFSFINGSIAKYRQDPKAFDLPETIR